MTTEDRLRRAIADRTSTVEPRTDGLARIEERLADTASSATHRSRLLMGSVAAGILVVALIAGALVLLDDDEAVITEPAATESSTTTMSDTTTTEAETTTTVGTTTSTTAPAPPPEANPDVALFPAPSTSRRFDDPVATVQSFATELIGIPNPVVGPFQQGDARSGEVEVRPRADGPVTTVSVRRMEDDAWYVVGAATASIRLDSPTGGATVGSPVHLTGAADAYEGTVDVRVFADGFTEPIGTGFVTGAQGSLGPFVGDVAFAAPGGATHGVIVLSTEGGEPSQPWVATVIRVRLG
jgi:hypothetical protein